MLHDGGGVMKSSSSLEDGWIVRRMSNERWMRVLGIILRFEKVMIGVES